MAKMCELCRQAPGSDMRFGVNLCQNCLNTYSQAMSGNAEAAAQFFDPQNFPVATPNAQRNIIEPVAKRYGRIEQMQQAAAEQQAQQAAAERQAQQLAAEQRAQTEQHEQQRKQYARSIGVDYRAVEEEETGLYANIGAKIKGWAKAVFVVETIFAVIIAFGMMFMGGLGIFMGIMLLVIGPLAAWVSSWLLYAFGELVDKTCANERHTQAMLKIMLQDRKR